MLALMRPDRAVEIEADIGAFIERIGAHFGALWFLADDAGQCGAGKLRCGEVQIAVATLKANLGFQRYAIADKAATRPLAHRPGQAIGEPTRMRAASHALTMGVEDQCGDIG